jgi:hypothetical protein
MNKILIPFARNGFNIVAGSIKLRAKDIGDQLISMRGVQDPNNVLAFFIFSGHELIVVGRNSSSAITASRSSFPSGTHVTKRFENRLSKDEVVRVLASLQTLKATI